MNLIHFTRNEVQSCGDGQKDEWNEESLLKKRGCVCLFYVRCSGAHQNVHRGLHVHQKVWAHFAQQRRASSECRAQDCSAEAAAITGFQGACNVASGSPEESPSVA